MSATDSSAKPYQLVGAPVHQNKWDAATEQIVGGWLYRARWLASGAIIPVFVADSLDQASTADTLIRFQGAQLDAVAKLGA